MNVRDAVETDADDVAALLDAPRSVADRLVRERTVVVAEREEPGDGENRRDELNEREEREDSGGGSMALAGVLAYDADEEAVHVTRLAGDADAVDRLLAEPIAFADREGLPVDVVLPESASSVSRAVETKGFESVGSGPQFAGETTTKYRRRRT